MIRSLQLAGRDLLLLVLIPAAGLWVLVVGAGLLVSPPGLSTDSVEGPINGWLAAARTPLWNAITDVWSHLGNIETIIATCLVVAALLLWVTRDWRFAAVPMIAVALETAVFILSSQAVARPRPEGVILLDQAPPTTSYPSGHVGATTALYLAFALLALRISQAWLRRLLIVICLVIPVLVAFARLYRGMHHVSDIGAGAVNGVCCALLAYAWYRHRDRDPQ